MSTDKAKQNRKFRRLPLTQEDTPMQQQVGGVAAKLLEHSFFELPLCNVILKDISLGGAGGIVPIDKQIPDKVKVVVGDKTSIRANIVHRKQIDDKLVFLGLDWSHESDKRCRQMLKVVGQLSRHEVNSSVAHKGEEN